MHEQDIPTATETGLADELDSYLYHQPASLGQRFLNFLIDNLLMRYGLSYITGSVVGLFLGTFFSDYAQKIIYDRTSFDFFLLIYLVGIVNYIVYYTFCEKVFKGYTLGKLITGTKALREDGTALTFRDALLRSICRLVPFEALSALGQRPWHDSWTKTIVTRTR
jgi:uncharacterized RDD family membrane protein YckC